MQIKVSLLDKRVLDIFIKILGAISTITSLILIFIDIPESCKGISVLLKFLIFLFIILLIIWLYANKLSKIKIDIGGTSIIIKKGDIFNEEGLKVIPFNEYFDTIVDNKIISEKSLNGKFVKRYFKNIDDLNELIRTDEDLNKKDNVIETNIDRKGNTTKYKLGSSLVIDDFIITAFSHFNEKNEANLSMSQYINFLLTFWNEINRVYAQKSVTVPVFGSGITRFAGKFNDIEINELLMTMLWTFKLSETRFKYPAKLTIVIYEDLFNKIDLFNLKGGIY